MYNLITTYPVILNGKPLSFIEPSALLPTPIFTCPSSLFLTDNYVVATQRVAYYSSSPLSIIIVLLIYLLFVSCNFSLLSCHSFSEHFPSFTDKKPVYRNNFVIKDREMSLKHTKNVSFSFFLTTFLPGTVLLLLPSRCSYSS